MRWQKPVTKNDGRHGSPIVSRHHPRQLDTPRTITDTSGNIVWQWDNQDPFGNNVPNENPSGQGQFSFDLRFPGQVYDKETNLSYNVNRDYDPAIGRYLQSDPIGLYGGQFSTYTYVNGNPLKYIDPTGENLLLWGLTALGLYELYQVAAPLYDTQNSNNAQLSNLINNPTSSSSNNSASNLQNGQQQVIRGAGEIGAVGSELAYPGAAESSLEALSKINKLNKAVSACPTKP